MESWGLGFGFRPLVWGTSDMGVRDFEMLKSSSKTLDVRFRVGDLEF